MIYDLLALAADPTAWLAFVTLGAMEIVLGVDNLVFLALLSSKLPPAQAAKARWIGIGLAVVLRLFLIAGAAYIVGLTAPLFSIFGQSFSWRDLILIGGGLFLVFKATTELHHTIDPIETVAAAPPNPGAFAATVAQIVILDLVFSIDSVITAVGMTEHVPIMIAAMIVAVVAMLTAAGPLTKFIHRNPTIVVLVLSFLFLIGATLIADGCGVHFPRGYIYAAMAFSSAVEGLNMLRKRGRSSRPVHKKAEATPARLKVEEPPELRTSERPSARKRRGPQLARKSRNQPPAHAKVEEPPAPPKAERPSARKRRGPQPARKRRKQPPQ
ncbi:MAG: TerC family protein [Beijerinckiaceae bacterium]